MRILSVHNRYTQQGGEDYVFDGEAALLRENGHDVYTWEEHNDSLADQSRVMAAVGTIWSFRSQRTLNEIIGHFQPEVVHFHNTFLRISPAVYYTCQQAGIPVIQTLHNYRLICPAATLFRDNMVCEDCLGAGGLWSSIKHRCWHSSRAQTSVVAAMLQTHRSLQTWNKQVDVYLALTEFARQKFIAGGLPAEKIVVKPNSVEPAPVEFSPSPQQPPFVLFVGRLSPEKGLMTLFEAWQELTPIPLKIAGDGPLWSELNRRIEQTGLHSVEMLGACSPQEILDLMGRASLLITPSIWYEGLPLTIIEAFSRRLPVLASHLGSMAEIVRHGETGLLFKPQDALDLTYWVRWAWEHPDEMKVIINNGYQQYQENYSPTANHDHLIRIYQSAMEQVAKR